MPWSTRLWLARSAAAAETGPVNDSVVFGVPTARPGHPARNNRRASTGEGAVEDYRRGCTATAIPSTMCALVPNCSIRSAGGGRRDDSSARGTLITTPPTPDGTVSRFLVYVAGARARHSQPRRRRGATSLSCRESTRLRGRPKVPPPSLPACPPLPSARSRGTRDTDTHGTVWRRRRRQIWGYYTVSTYILSLAHTAAYHVCADVHLHGDTAEQGTEHCAQHPHLRIS